MFKNKKEEVFNHRKPKKCPICGNTFETWGNNPQPITSGLCCDNCNYKYVLPFRIFLTLNNIYLYIPEDSSEKLFGYDYCEEDLNEITLICKHLGINKEKLLIYNYQNLIFYYSNERNGSINNIASIITNKTIKGNVIIRKKGEINV